MLISTPSIQALSAVGPTPAAFRLRASALSWIKRQSGTLFLLGSPSELAEYAFRDSSATLPAAVGDPVGYLRERTPINYVATQATDADRPTIAQVASGVCALSFGGAIRGLTAPVPLTSDHTVIIAATAGTLPMASNLTLFDGVSNTERSSLGVLPSGALNAFGGSASITSAAGVIVAAVPFVLTAIFSGAASSLSLNGSVVASGNPGTHSLPSGIRIGADRNGSSGWSGTISAVAVCSGVMPSPGAEIVAAYLATLGG